MDNKTTTLNYNTPTFAGRITRRWAVTETIDIRETYLFDTLLPFTVEKTTRATELRVETIEIAAFETFDEAVAFATA